MASSQEIKLYVFLTEDENGNEEIINQVRAYNHDHAVMIANDPRVTQDTDFYSTDAWQPDEDGELEETSDI